jgi:hypothetical protein
MVPRAMSKRGKDWISLAEEQENTLVDLAIHQLGRALASSHPCHPASSERDVYL